MKFFVPERLERLRHPPNRWKIITFQIKMKVYILDRTTSENFYHRKMYCSHTVSGRYVFKGRSGRASVRTKLLHTLPPNISTRIITAITTDATSAVTGQYKWNILSENPTKKILSKLRQKYIQVTYILTPIISCFLYHISYRFYL